MPLVLHIHRADGVRGHIRFLTVNRTKLFHVKQFGTIDGQKSYMASYSISAVDV
jgi:LPS sulfotransferase NodH